MTMTLEQTQAVAKTIHEGLRRNGTVVLYSAAFERIVGDAINAHLAWMGEPVAKVAKNESGQIYIEFRHKKSIASFIGAEFYTAPPINLAAVREVIAELRESADGPGTTFVTDDDLLWYANKLEAAIGDKT